jgi:UDP-N-acetylmuramate dehydrogenase
VPEYPGVEKYFSEKDIHVPSLKEIRNAIIYIRRSKLPDPSIIPNCGSFFENPIIDRVLAQGIKARFPDMKYFDLPDGTVKVPAGWLVEKVGFKGQMIGNGKIKVHPDNALVLTNIGDATFSDLIQARDEIISKVNEMFGIVLEMEPNIVK